MFRAPNVEAARARRKSGWDSHQQRQKIENWLRAQGLEPPHNADECWELVLNELCITLIQTPGD